MNTLTRDQFHKILEDVGIASCDRDAMNAAFALGVAQGVQQEPVTLKILRDIQTALREDFVVHYGSYLSMQVDKALENND